MGSCGDSADGWEETREGTRRRQGRRRGIICNVSTLGWAALAWWHLTSEAAHRTGTRQRGLGRVLACCCVSLCCVYCCALPRQQRAGGRWRQNTVAASHPWPPPDQAWSPHRQHQPPRPHQLPAAAAATPPAGGRHAPSCGPGGRGGCWVAVCGAGGAAVRAACLLIRASSRPPLAAVWLCPVLGAVSSVCLSLQPDMGPWAGAVCSVQCEQGSRAPDNWLINTLSIIQQVDKLCFISQLDNFLLLLRATRPNLEIVDINKLGLLILQPVWPKS